MRVSWTLVALCCLFAPLSGPLQAQEREAPPGWGTLRPGAPVGFRVLRVEDPTRAYGPMPGPGGETWVARPLQLGVWYPADEGSGAPMRLADVVELAASEQGDAYATPAARREARLALALGPISFHLREGEGRDETLARVLDLPLLARLDAEPAPGRHPVVLHTGQLHAQLMLNEYLASHGYVVVGVPLMGSSPAWHGRGEPGAAMWKAIVRDLGVAAGAVGRFPFADADRTAVVGMLAAGGLLHAMRDPRSDGIALLDAWLPPALRELPGWDPSSVRVPVLALRNTLPGRSDGALLDSLRHAPVTRVVIDSLAHRDFYPFARWVRPDSADALHPEHAAVIRYARAFLDDALREGPPLDAALPHDGLASGRASLIHRPSGPTPPREASILTWARYGRAEDALEAVRAALAADPDARPVDAGELLTVARFLHRDGRRADAATVSRAVLLLDPDDETARTMVEEAGGG